jgi:NitT/TauT family transport system substrate-binding protein
MVFRLVGAAAGWLVLISALHYWRNGDHFTGRTIKLAHMPVIANLAAPLLDEASRGDQLRFVAVKYGSFAEMADAFRTRNVDVAFIIAPLPLVLRSQGVPAKIVYIGNRHESTLVARRELNVPRGGVALLAGRTVAVPLKFSGHNLALRRLLAKEGLTTGSVRVVEMQPPDMAAALQAGSLDAYFVGEPFAAKSVKAGLATVVQYVEDDWPGFICNLMIVREELIAAEPEIVRRLVHGAIRSSAWAEAHPDGAAAIAGRRWGQDPALLRYAIGTPPGRVRFRQGVPKPAEILEIYREMAAAGLIDGKREELAREVVDDSFALSADTSGIGTDLRTVLDPTGTAKR